MQSVKEEIWKPIPGLSGEFEASSHGRIRRILPTSKWGNYVSVHIKRKNLLVHRLICAAFVGDPHGFVVNHKNGNPTDNRPENLEPVSPSANTTHAVLLGRIPAGEKNGLAKLTPETVMAIRESKEPHRIIAKRYGLGQSHVSRIRRGESWKHLPGPTCERFVPIDGVKAKFFTAARFTFQGESKTITEWAATVGMNRCTLANRLYGLKWPIDKALTIPTTKVTNRKLTEEQVCRIINGHETQKSLAEEFGVCQAQISRIRQRKRWADFVP